MAINTLAAATLFMTMLDTVAVQEATTGWMEANAGRVLYNGGKDVKMDWSQDAEKCPSGNGRL